MRVFVTGATGFVGSAVVRELLAAKHHVVGLARSQAAAASLTAAGADVHRGELTDLASLRRGAESADAVIHLGFIHDFSDIKTSCEIDRRAIEAIGSALEGSDRPFIVTSGTALVAPGRLATEDDAPAMTADAFPRVATEEATRALAERGVRVALVRLSPSVHGDDDHGFVPTLIGLARKKGVSAYVGDGANSWNAVHRFDAAVLYRLALEQAAGGARYHAVGEERIAFRDIAETIAKRLDLPVKSVSVAESAGHFGWFAHFAALDCPASSRQTRERLGWHPTQPGLIDDLERSTRYFEFAHA